MKGIRLSVIFKFDSPFFFENNYKDAISNFLLDKKLKHFTFSDLVCKRKKVQGEGFYALNEARFDISMFNDKSLIDLMNSLVTEGINFKYGRAKINSVTFRNVPYFNEGYLLSPAFALNKNKSIDYTENPELFSETIRNRLIEKYIQIYGIYPKNDSFIFIFNKKVEKIFNRDLVCFKSKFEMYGSKDLIYTANVLGIGDNTDLGYGMISSDLYFYKNSANMLPGNKNLVLG